MAFPRFMKDKEYPHLGLALGWFLGLVLTGVVVFVLAILAVAWKIESYSCSVDQARYGKPTHYQLLVGCFIETEPHVWVNLGQYQNFHAVGK